MSEEQKMTPGLLHRVGRALTAAADRVYRLEYGIGLQTARLLRRLRRALKRWLLPVSSGLRAVWRRKVAAPVNCALRKWRLFFFDASRRRRELSDSAHKSVFAAVSCFFRQFWQGICHFRRELIGLTRLAALACAIIVLATTVSVWTHMDFCLALTYRGQRLGYIDNENTYNVAADMALDRVVNVDNSFTVEAVPKLAITTQRQQALLSDAELCDAILRTAGDSIAEATGLYVNGDFIGAMESADELNALLEEIKSHYYDKKDKDQRAEFIQDVSTAEGLYPALAVVEGDTMKTKLTSEAVVKKTYTVQEGDTLARIALRNNMTVSELRAMNTGYADSDMVRIGDVLTVQQPQAFLQVKMIKTIRYSEPIAFTTQYVSNTKKPVTYTKVKTRGQDGSRDIVAEITYINGIETGRRTVSNTIAKQPVTQVEERGTQKVVTDGGKEVVVGDGVVTGKMLWPVPAVHSMSQRYGRGHSGIDIANGPVKIFNKSAVAADGGTVIHAGWYYGYGNFVKIQHANGLCTAYGHLNSISVVKGQKVSRGQEIGRVGTTGQSTGPHLHFEVYKNNVRVNPLNYVTP